MIDRNQLKILLIDLELTYALFYAYPESREQYLPAKNIKHHQFCPCAAWKWHHEISKYSVKITDDPKRFKKNFRDDYIVAKKLHDLMTEADVIVAHNGDAFDIKHSNTLFSKHGLGPVPETKSIDTLKAARKYFKFAGNDLDSLSRRFGGPGKAERPDWKIVTEGNADEINRAARYCMKDVVELERVFINIRSFIRRLPYLAKAGDVTECHACGSKRVQKRGGGFDGRKPYTRVRCVECGHEHKQRIK